MRKFIFTLMLAIAGSVWTISEAKVTEQLEDDPCSQYTLVVEPHIDSTVTYMFTGELLHNQPYVDSVWITGVREDSATIYLVSYAQPNEKIDLSSSLRMGRYFFFAQIEDCVKVRPLNFRGRWATDFPKGMTWTTFFTPYEGCDSWSYTCELQDNTFIEGRSYSIVHGPVDIPIRQYGQKIYAWINNKDYLLYDFGLEIGDSIPQYYFGISADASQIDVYGQVYAHVLRIDSVLLEDGRKAKRLWYDGRMPDIEYVGSEYGILSPIIMPDITTCGGTHMCCSLDGGLIYETEPGICNSIGELHPLRLPSLCDEWHVLRYSGATLPWDEYDFSTYVEKLTTDTIIHGNRYVKLMSGGGYRGALREGDNRDIYFIPARGDHEFLLYAFNAQAGDTLTNLWLGGTAEMVPQNGYKAVITAISDDSPRIFNIKYIPASEEGERLVPPQVIWREGIGLYDGPVSVECPTCACSCGYLLLCAYKDGEQVYGSKESEDWGCNFNYHPRPLNHIESLCDEWKIVIYPFLPEPERTTYYTQRLALDTIINGKQYRQLRGGSFKWWYHERKEEYLGALVEWSYKASPRGYKKGIFYVPPQSTHEYMLYAFQAEVGDTLSNLWIGGREYYYRDGQGFTAVVTDIRAGSPREFVLKLILPEGTEYGASEYISWIDGVGLKEGGPVGWESLPGEPVDPSPELLCACKDGKKVYSTQTLCKCGSMRLNNFCDTWNILGNSYPNGFSHYSTFTQRLTTDTLINNTRYAKLEQGSTYLGALREDDYGRIYYIPASTSHEYLLCVSQAKVTDSFSNVWFGGNPSDFPNGSKATVRAIEIVNGRKVFKLDVEYKSPGMEQSAIWQYSWIAGVGLPQGPVGYDCPFDCEGDYGQGVLCAYKDGEQVYASELSQEFGCNYTNLAQDGDTVKLYRYVKDSPGSSTVDPVDPNQIVATLLNDVLTIREYTGEEITYSLKKSPAGTPFRHNEQAQTKLVREDTFRNTVSVTITEDGSYRLDLTNPEWGYGIYGTFDYGKSAIEPVVPEAAAVKILRNGQLLIRQGDRIFTPTGMQVE